MRRPSIHNTIRHQNKNLIEFVLGNIRFGKYIFHFDMVIMSKKENIIHRKIVNIVSIIVKATVLHIFKKEINDNSKVKLKISTKVPLSALWQPPRPRCVPAWPCWCWPRTRALMLTLSPTVVHCRARRLADLATPSQLSAHRPADVSWNVTTFSWMNSYYVQNKICQLGS